MDNHQKGWEVIGDTFESMGLPESAFMARQHGRIVAAGDLTQGTSMFWSIVELENRLTKLESLQGISNVAPRAVATSDSIANIQPILDQLDTN